jgi:hypothetical protein
MVELLRLLSFLLFVALGLRVRRTRDERGRRRAVQQLLAYVLALSAAVGAAQWDDWPFTSHTLAVGRPRADSRVCQTRFLGLDADGREWRLDPYAFTPVYDSILQYWVEQALPRLDEPGRQRALGFLLARAEQSRRRLARGAAIGPQRRLGPAGASYWLMLPRHTEAPAAPYAGLRILSGCWSTRSALGQEAPPAWRLLAEWPPADLRARD